MYKKILFPVDLQHIEEAKKSLKVTIREARHEKADVCVMTVAPGFGMPIVASYFDENTFKEAMKEVARQLHAYMEESFPDDIKTTAIVVDGNPAELILEQAKKDESDLIVMSSHNSQIENLLLGSVAAKVVRHSRCSVIVVK